MPSELDKRKIQKLIEERAKALLERDATTSYVIFEISSLRDFPEMNIDLEEVVALLEQETNAQIELIDLVPQQSISDPVSHHSLDIENSIIKVKYHKNILRVSPLIENKLILNFDTRSRYLSTLSDTKKVKIESKIMINVLTQLIDAKHSFVDTKTLAEPTETTEQNVRETIGDCRKKVEHFGIKGKDFIISDRGLGYRLGDHTEINIEK